MHGLRARYSDALVAMKYVLRITIALFLGLAATAAPARAFSLLDPSFWNPSNWPFSFVPVPEVATDPNGGTTYGLLPVFLFNDAKGQIRNILAPDITNNATLGVGATFRFLSYPSADTQWYAIAGFQRKIARRVDLSYSTGRSRQGPWSFNARFYFERDPTERFFGIGNDSELGNQTNYTTEQVYLQLMLGWNISPKFQLALVLRPRYVRIKRGAFDNLPSIFSLFPTVKGINGGTEVLNELRFSYDTRDSVDIPHSGTLAMVFGSISDRRLFSSSSYDRFGGDVRHYFPLSRRFTLATHAFLQFTPAGSEPPFWAMARLGGEESLLIDQQTLRGFGAGRFIDNNLAVINIELRARVFGMDIFGTHGVIELAPFLDVGRVFHTMTTNFLSDPHPVGGIGFRGIAEPFVVGYVDVGYGGEGTAVFSGINYPF